MVVFLLDCVSTSSPSRPAPACMVYVRYVCINCGKMMRRYSVLVYLAVTISILIAVVIVGGGLSTHMQYFVS